jgi:hypothetical protein
MKFAVRAVILRFLILLLPLIPLSADSFSDNLSWAARGSLFVFAANNGPAADPIPILPSLGVSLAWNFWGPLSLELSEDLYFSNYEYDYERGYPMACSVENRSAFVLGFLTGIQLSAFFPIDSKGIGVRVYGGPAMDIRVIIQSFGNNYTPDKEDIKNQTEAISGYFWGEGRWLYPVLGAGMDFPLTEKYLLGFDLRTWFPLYRLWTDKNLPGIDGWRFGAGFRITPR